MAVLAGSVTVLVAAHALGFGAIVDIAFLGVTIAVMGRDSLEAARAFERFYRYALVAQNEDGFGRAGKEFAHAVTIVGINSFIVLFAKSGRTLSNAAIRGVRNIEALKAAWIATADNIELRVPRDKGMLWTQLDRPGIWAGAISERNSAISVARENGLVALESILKQQGVLEQIERTFGETFEDVKRAGLEKVTQAFWDRVSDRYAAALEGKVTVYVHGPELVKALKAGSRPILYRVELPKIVELMQENGRITEIEIVEVRSGLRHSIRRGFDH
jgi:hypothetical protein